MIRVAAHDPQDAECAEVLERLLDRKMANGVYYMAPGGVYFFDGGEPQTVSWSAQCDPTKWGTPDAVKLPNRFPYTQVRTRPMKGDFYNSSTHGRIRLSVKGRQLLAAEREAAQNAIADGDFNANGQALSRARGDIAQHIADLELTLREKLSAEQVDRLTVGYGAGNAKTQHIRRVMNTFPWRNFQFLGFDESSDFNPLRYKKETPVTDQKNAEQTTPAPKTRSELLGEATRELVQAQQELEYILADKDKPAPAELYLGGRNNVGHCTTSAITQLVKEQWDGMVKKVTARAKARVAKAEKAVAALLAG